MHTKATMGHLLVLLTVLIWGTTFISTKVLLEDFRPVEILFMRFAIALPALWLACPRLLRGTTLRQEAYMAAAGFCGICLYYLLENIALTYTLAANVGIIISTTPFFTALLTALFLRGEEKLHLTFFIGFIVSMLGISLMSFGGDTPQLNPMGDILALLAALVWAGYSIFIKKIQTFGYSTILTTRRTIAYGLLFMLPLLPLFGFQPELARLQQLRPLSNLLYLGLGASAACFVTWGFAVKLLGAVRASIYIYLIPVITVVSAVLLLGESISPTAGIGAALTLAGVVLSEGRFLRADGSPRRS